MQASKQVNPTERPACYLAGRLVIVAAHSDSRRTVRRDSPQSSPIVGPKIENIRGKFVHCVRHLKFDATNSIIRLSPLKVEST